MYDIGAIVGRIILKDDYSAPLKRAESASTKFGAEVQKTSSQVDRSADQMASSLEEVKQAASGLGTVISALGTGAFVAGVTAAFRGLSDAGGELEQTLISYETLLGGSVQATQELVGELNELANVTPFTNQQILSAGKQLLAFGAEADEVSSMLTMVGDVAAATGKDFNELALIYGKAMTAGVVQAEELNQLSEAGVPIIKVLAEQFGVAESQVKKLGSEGKIQFSDLEEAFASLTGEGGLFFEMMSRQSETFNGMLSTLGGILGNLAAEAGQSINSVLKPAVSALISIAQTALDVWTSLPQPVREGAAAFAMVAAATTAVVMSLPLLISGIKAAGAAFTAAFVSNPVGLILTGISVAIAAVVAAVLKMQREWSKFATFFRPITDAIDRVKDAFSRLVDSLPDNPFSAIIDNMSDAADGIDVFATVIKAALFPAVSMITSLIGAFRVLTTVVKGFVDNGGAMVSMLKEIGRLAAALIVPGGLISWIRSGGPADLKGAMSDLGSGLSDTFSRAGDIIADTSRQIQGSFDDIVTKAEETKDKVVEQVKETAKEAQKQGAPAMKEAADSLVDAFAKGWTEGLAFLSGDLIGGKIGAEIKANADKVGQAIQGVFDGVMANIEAANELTLAKIRQTMEQASLIGDVALAAAKKRHEQELASFEAAEDAKINAMREAQIERIALIDEEFARRKEQLDLEFEALVEQERKKFELRLMELEREAAGDELRKQRQLARTQMEEDWRAYVESLQNKHNEEILIAEQEKAARVEEETAQSNAAIEAAEQAKADAIVRLKEQQAAREEQIEKQAIAVQALLEYQAFQASKQMQLAQATISYGMSIMSAVQAGASIAASLPLVGPFLGPAFTAMMIALATSTYSTTRGIIAASTYTPPAALFAAEGGVIQGPPHSAGGVMVNAEGGEAFLSRSLTTKLDNYISNNESTTQVVFAEGSIVVQGDMDSAMVDRLATLIAARIEQRRY